MHHRIDGVLLRKPEPKDVEALYSFKNDVEIAGMLGGFSSGYTRSDLVAWVDFHAKAKDEALWIIADASTDGCLGHVGLYRIDHRVQSAEFAILIGDRARWGAGLGRELTRFTVRYAFRTLNLQRVELTVLSTNARARRLYEKLGFVVEGTRRRAQVKDGAFVDVVLMSILRDEASRDLV